MNENGTIMQIVLNDYLKEVLQHSKNTDFLFKFLLSIVAGMQPNFKFNFV